jgi:hypothetical protein
MVMAHSDYSSAVAPLFPAGEEECDRLIELLQPSNAEGQLLRIETHSFLLPQFAGSRKISVHQFYGGGVTTLARYITCSQGALIEHAAS